VDTKKILSDLRAELDRVNRAIVALEALSDTVHTGAVTKAAESAAKPRRRMSAAGRRRISEAAKARWAERREQTAKPASTKQSGGRRKMSPAARKRISAMMKKRWAERRKKAV
jgi:uncharacterized protein YaiI (UPF0178 family)